MNIFTIADLHGKLPVIPEDCQNSDTVLVLAGDICPNFAQNFTPGIKHYDRFLPTGWDTFWNFRQVDIQSEVEAQRNWIKTELIPHLQDNRIDFSKVIWISGNHDYAGAGDIFANSVFKGAKTVSLEGKRIGLISGVTKLIGEWSDELEETEFRERIKELSPDIDILVSHTPPYGILDTDSRGMHMGSQALYEAIFGKTSENEPYFTNLDVHIFGHVHKNVGKERFKIENRLIKFYNCAEKGFQIKI